MVGNPVKPGRKTGLSPEAANVLVRAHKRILGKVISQGQVSPGKLPQEAAHARLMPTNQLAKSVLVVINKNSSNEIRIGQLHIWTLG